jgi:hypothetical protein
MPDYATIHINEPYVDFSINQEYVRKHIKAA